MTRHLKLLCFVPILAQNPIIFNYFITINPRIILIGPLALKLQRILLPVQFFTIIGYSFRATLTTLGKQELFFIPAILILPRACGILGLQLAQPVADFLTFTLTQVIVVMKWK